MTGFTIFMLLSIGVLVFLQIRSDYKNLSEEDQNETQEINLPDPRCGIGCDNKFCDFVDANVTVGELKDWLNKPCPKCDSNLLTEEDYARSQKVLDAYNIAQQMTPEQQKEILSKIDPVQVLQSPMFANLTPAQKSQMKDFLSGNASDDPFSNATTYISTQDEIKIDSVVKDEDHKYKVIRDVNIQECEWLEEDIPFGTELYRHFGTTWDNVKEGCVAVEFEKGSREFFSIPMDAVKIVKDETV